MTPDAQETDVREAPDATVPGARTAWHGLVDYYGFHTGSGAWFLVGWIEAPHIPPDRPASVELRVDFETGTLTGPATVTYFHRPDLGERGSGIVLHFPSPGRFMGRLVWLDIAANDRLVGMTVPGDSQHLRGVDVGTRVFAELSHAGGASDSRAILLERLTRKGFTGEDTLAAMKGVVQLELDAAIPCRGEGVVLMGWMAADAPPTVRLRAGAQAVAMTEANTIRIPRPDVVSALGAGRAEMECGFITYLKLAPSGTDPLYLEAETARGEIGYRPVAAPALGGIEAIRRVLSGFDLRYDQLAPAFDAVIGPAVRALNAERMERRPRIGVVTLGAPPPTPRHSVIVPLYGRIDFLEYQAALFARHGLADTELIYVLDDPDKRRELEALAVSVHARFGLPFSLLLLDRNMGFAPANNIGLAHARAKFVCFMNSDVFPDTPGWLGALSARLDADPKLGAVGPLLLFENGTVQHQGMAYETLAEFGGWTFPLHPRKGMKPRPGTALLASPAITAACMMLRRADADDLGGFDESYVIGDFEDSDLCRRLAARGLGCAVDPAVRLYHLERRSQVGAAQRWRMNMTLYNAWLHQARWFARQADHHG